MDKKTQTCLIIAGIAVVGYMIWKRNQENGSETDVIEEETEGFTNIGGRRRRKKEKWDAKMDKFCHRHPDHPNCIGGTAGGGTGGGVTTQTGSSW